MKEDFVLKKTEAVLTTCLANHLAFYAYKHPNSQHIEIGIQKDMDLLKYTDFADLDGLSGFVMAPFVSTEQHSSWFIRDDFNFSSFGDDEIELLSQYKNTIEEKEDKTVTGSKQDEYFTQIAAFLDELKAGSLEKAILSRIQLEKGISEVKRAALFLQLCQCYPHAFVSFVSLPGICSWMGASPELLFKSQNNNSETVALAGTLPINKDHIQETEWGNKEIEEQAFVSDYIERVFRDNAICDYEKIGPYTVQAGQIVHLKTDFRTDANLSFKNKARIISALHPTPAVCGLPKTKALDLIKRVESHDREYYAGFWGPVHANGDCALYVNLRTMKLSENHLSLFVGGGITADSIPQKEWEETQHKAQTLLSVINQFVSS
ncbi:isochorismate synthase [Ancylomarina salipaludis]|uniref:isochorismate synthase n=1 Tax=Ancylomarina salipaludis TaxID=2501299 RepID=A0A4V1N036_9BACT|nr:chorismate-binding protein [Ancylomarina salipaludis]RXQ94411.1 isochorismate synthase [Ancylomarina salipaludis]